jgi:signal transduction histidine kinase
MNSSASEPSRGCVREACLLSIRAEVGALSNEIRRIAYQLHPSSLDHLGLAVALRSLCNEFAEREKLEVKFAVRKGQARRNHGCQPHAVGRAGSIVADHSG